MIVVDTNVITYLWLPGPATRKAEALLQRDPEWSAPLLWRSEFRNVLAGAIRRRLVEVEVALRIAAAAEEHMQGREFAVTSTDVLELFVSSRCSAYDCEFVALAQDLGIPLVTTDRQLLADFPEIATPLERVIAG